VAPLVSVVMPSFNAGRKLAPALRSAFEQTHPNLEVIFIDNNSSDGSVELAKATAAQFQRPFQLLHCPEQGCNPPRNLGYALARGDYIQWLDADDALGVQKIELQVAALERSRDADFAYCDWMHSRHSADGRRFDQVIALQQVDDQILRSLSGVWYPPHSYLIRRAAADRLQAEGAWHPSRKVGTDVEYTAMAAMLGMRFRHVPAARIQYNSWSNTQLSSAGTRYAQRVAALRDIYARLRELAARPDVAPRIGARHRTLLNQNWDVWAMPRNSVELRALSTRLHQMRHRASGRTIELRPRETVVAQTLHALGTSKAIAHHALFIAAKAPALANDFAFIVATLSRFAGEGMLTPVDLSVAPDTHAEPAAPAFAVPSA
jgi:hypothetical protein